MSLCKAPILEFLPRSIKSSSWCSSSGWASDSQGCSQHLGLAFHSLTPSYTTILTGLAPGILLTASSRKTGSAGELPLGNKALPKPCHSNRTGQLILLDLVSAALTNLKLLAHPSPSPPESFFLFLTFSSAAQNASLEPRFPLTCTSLVLFCCLLG